MSCKCSNYLIRKISVRGEYLLVETDKVFVIHRSEIKQIFTKRASCHHVCEIEYLYIITPHQEIPLYMQGKTYNELLHHILNIFYPEETYSESFTIKEEYYYDYD